MRSGEHEHAFLQRESQKKEPSGPYHARMHLHSVLLTNKQQRLNQEVK